MPQYVASVEVAQLSRSMILTTIPFSHFCEKARWALDYYGVPYVERKYLPLLHTLPVLWQSRGQGKMGRHSTPASTPVLTTDRGQRICDSSEIAAYLSARFGREGRDLYPPDAPQVWSLERRFSRELGPQCRILAYHYGLPHSELFLQMFRSNVGAFQMSLVEPFYDQWAALIRKLLHIHQDNADRALAKVSQLYDEVELLLHDGRRFLTGDRLTAADITFAALSTPLLFVRSNEGFEAGLPSYEDPSFDPKLVELVRSFRERPAGEFALRMYREHRRGERLRWV